jgi:hypothetical protein
MERLKQTLTHGSSVEIFVDERDCERPADDLLKF